MACSASAPATRLSAARNSRDIECAKYSVRLTNPNATHRTMIKTEPLAFARLGVRRATTNDSCRICGRPECGRKNLRGTAGLRRSFMAVLRWLFAFDWLGPVRRSARRVRLARPAGKRVLQVETGAGFEPCW